MQFPDAVLNSVAHLVERAGQCANFVMPGFMAAGSQVARTKTVGHILQSRQTRHDSSIEQEPHEQQQ